MQFTVAYNVQYKIQNYIFKHKCKVDHSKLIQTAEKREKAERNKEKKRKKTKGRDVMMLGTALFLRNVLKSYRIFA